MQSPLKAGCPQRAFSAFLVSDIGFQPMILVAKGFGIGKKPVRYSGENIKLKRRFDFRQCLHDTGGARGMPKSVGRYEKSNASGRGIRLISIRH